jgi:uncharacterized membrane protein
MAFCKSCGTALNETSAFCAACGAGNGAAAATTMPPAAAAGMSSNAAGALCYLIGAITGIIFLVLDPYKRDRFVRFHAFQSIFFNVAWIALWVVWMIVGAVLGAITKGLFFLLQIPIDLLLALGGFGLWIYLMYSAYQNRTVKLPIVGQLAEKQAGL